MHHPEALFDAGAPKRSAASDGYAQARSRSPRARPICPRDSDLKPYGDAHGQSIAAMRGPGKAEYSKVPRHFAHELTISAYRTLMDLDMARARRDIDALRAHAAANAWIPAQNSEPAASAAIEAVGAVLPAWQILRQTSVATDDDRAVVEGWLLRVSRFTDIHPGGNSIGTQRGTNEMLLGLIVGDDALYQGGSARRASTPVARHASRRQLSAGDRSRAQGAGTHRPQHLAHGLRRADRPVAGDRSLRDRSRREEPRRRDRLSAQGGRRQRPGRRLRSGQPQPGS